MSDIALANLLPVMQRYPDLLLSQISHFIGFARKLKKDIILTQPPTLMPELQRFARYSPTIHQDILSVQLWTL
jgi:hypothetical protein